MGEIWGVLAADSVWSKPYIQRSGPIPFTTMGMSVGALFLVSVSAIGGSFEPVSAFGPPQWLAVIYLGLFGSALTFYLWAFALSRTTPTRVAISVTINPITAALVGAVLLDEPIRWNLVTGLMAVLLGISIASAVGRPGASTRMNR
jgi:drug/metabolite transporter (DMT)-like permease